MREISQLAVKNAAIIAITTAIVFSPFTFSKKIGASDQSGNDNTVSLLQAEAKKKKKKVKKKASRIKSSFSTTISIAGDKTCTAKTTDALKLLKEKAPDYFETVEKYVGVIECADQGSGIYVWEKPPRYKAGSATTNAGTIWYAGTMAHESCHSKQYQDHLIANPEASYVPSAAYFGEAPEAECLAFQYSALEKLGASQSTLDYVKGLLDTRYWEIAYENRWW